MELGAAGLSIVTIVGLIAAAVNIPVTVVVGISAFAELRDRRYHYKAEHRTGKGAHENRKSDPGDSDT